MKALLAGLRPQYWIRNALVFVPLITSHEILNAGLLLQSVIAAVAFCLAASGGYLVNDVFDSRFDREHPVKQHRPAAAATLTLRNSGLAAAGLWLAALAIACSLLPLAFVGVIAAYILAVLAYSACIKHLVVLDVVLLATFYCARIIAGGIAIQHPVTTWLLAFSMFLFFSLAVLKRYAETAVLRVDEHAPGRPYSGKDARVLLAAGIASAFAAVVLLMLYINSLQAASLYARPGVLSLGAALVAYWLLRLWLLASRGSIRVDPFLFCMRDRVTYAVLAATSLVLLLAK